MCVGTLDFDVDPVRVVLVVVAIVSSSATTASMARKLSAALTVLNLDGGKLSQVAKWW